MKFRIFVVDDDRHYSRMISYRLEKNVDYDVHVFHRGEDMLEKVDVNPHLVLLDIMMPGIGGIETLKLFKKKLPETPVVMVSAQGVIDTAVEAMQFGAYDYITKGQDDLVKMETVVRNVLEKVKLEGEIENLRGVVQSKYSMTGLVGDSPPMQHVYRTMEKAVRGDLTVAILGESGTGKELVAKAIHYGSSRKKAPFVVVNCAAIPRELMESEFFGHEKGSFTGAHSRTIGKFEQADGGTIFLDEIGELDHDLQAKLLRALQSFEITRVGGNETISFDARVISATNRDIKSMIQKGTFREDLYYRLFQFPVPLPPLRERGQDVIRLANHFMKEYMKDHPEFKGKRLTAETRKAIAEYAWPGNVRELKSAVERSILVSDAEDIAPGDLMINGESAITPWNERSAPRISGALTADPPGSNGVGDASYDYEEYSDEVSVSGIVIGNDGDHIMSLEDLKKQAIERAYRLCEGNVDRAAVELGIGRATMYRLLKKFEIMS
ncbi:MAG: sigma-54-dependent Fis family transcriptional regulator [Rhodothermales bacterium]|nr:sigma-54-dependent Fis family transcriptional regulator [Rhodothermales bacterium]